MRVERLRVSHAFHSALMEPMVEEFGRRRGGWGMQTPRVALVSSVTGGVVEVREVRRGGVLAAAGAGGGAVPRRDGDAGGAGLQRICGDRAGTTLLGMGQGIVGGGGADVGGVAAQGQGG